MSILQYNEITVRKYIDLNGEPYEVVASQVSRKQANKPVNKTKIKSLITGKVIEKPFHSSEKVEEADLEHSKVKYLYENKGEYWFCDPENPRDRFVLSQDIVGKSIRFVKANNLIESLSYKDKIIGVKIPKKVPLEVKEAPPAVKGNTAQGATKVIVLETGATINAPLFIEEGEILNVNTEEGTYVERVNK